MTIQQATENDIIAILYMLRALYMELGEEASSVQFLNEQLITDMLSSGNTSIYLAKNEQQGIVGILTLTVCQAIYAGGKYGIIDEMYVIPELRSSTIGMQLVQVAKEAAGHNGWHRIDVTAPTEDRWVRTIEFYKKMGFVFTGAKLKFHCL